MMKIKTKILTGFLKKSVMEGEQAISECILHFEKDGLKINANSPAQQARVMSWLKKTAFKDYEEFGKVGLNDLQVIIRVLDRFDEMIQISKEGNLLTIKGENKKVDVELIAETFLATDTGEPKLEFEDTFGITATKLHEIFKDVQINKDAVITISTEEKKAKFKNTGKYKFENAIEAPSCKGGVNVRFGMPLIDAVANMDGNLEVSVKTDYPIKVMEKLEDSVVTVIVAPRVESEE